MQGRRARSRRPVALAVALSLLLLAAWPAFATQTRDAPRLDARSRIGADLVELVVDGPRLAETRIAFAARHGDGRAFDAPAGATRVRARGHAWTTLPEDGGEWVLEPLASLVVRGTDLAARIERVAFDDGMGALPRLGARGSALLRPDGAYALALDPARPWPIERFALELVLRDGERVRFECDLVAARHFELDLDRWSPPARERLHPARASVLHALSLSANAPLELDVLAVRTELPRATAPLDVALDGVRVTREAVPYAPPCLVHPSNFGWDLEVSVPAGAVVTATARAPESGWFGALAFQEGDRFGELDLQPPLDVAVWLGDEPAVFERARVELLAPPPSPRDAPVPLVATQRRLERAADGFVGFTLPSALDEIAHAPWRHPARPWRPAEARVRLAGAPWAVFDVAVERGTDAEAPDYVVHAPAAAERTLFPLALAPELEGAIPSGPCSLHVAAPDGAVDVFAAWVLPDESGAPELALRHALESEHGARMLGVRCGGAERGATSAFFAHPDELPEHATLVPSRGDVALLCRRDGERLVVEARVALAPLADEPEPDLEAPPRAPHVTTWSLGDWHGVALAPIDLGPPPRASAPVGSTLRDFAYDPRAVPPRRELEPTRAELPPPRR